jgi:galactose mutarotase-like enzyme
MSGMISSIQNNWLQVAVASKGAELQSIIHKDFGIEYMWSGDPAFWGKKSPILFPVVGGLKNNSYQHNGEYYQLSRHGFARDMLFEIAAQNDTTVTFTLISTKETQQIYPFDFRLSVRYSLNENKLSVSYIIENTGIENLLFSIGGHPAFKVPLAEGTVFDDYYLKFGSLETASKSQLSPSGLIEDFSEPVLENEDIIPLHKSLFYQDALVFKELTSNNISLMSHKDSHGLNMSFEGFPYLGIWSAKDANFVCIEPWCGIADSVNASGVLEDKEGINSISPRQKFERTWSIELF